MIVLSPILTLSMLFITATSSTSATCSMWHQISCNNLRVIMMIWRLVLVSDCWGCWKYNGRWRDGGTGLHSHQTRRPAWPGLHWDWYIMVWPHSVRPHQPPQLVQLGKLSSKTWIFIYQFQTLTKFEGEKFLLQKMCTWLRKYNSYNRNIIILNVLKTWLWLNKMVRRGPVQLGDGGHARLPLVDAQLGQDEPGHNLHRSGLPGQQLFLWCRDLQHVIKFLYNQQRFILTLKRPCKCHMARKLGSMPSNVKVWPWITSNIEHI